MTARVHSQLTCPVRTAADVAHGIDISKRIGWLRKRTHSEHGGYDSQIGKESGARGGWKATNVEHTDFRGMHMAGSIKPL